MTKYIEELKSGECFKYHTEYFIVTIDFKSNNDKLCINLADGIPKWFSSNTIVDLTSIFIVDNDGNILPVITQATS